MLTVSKLSSSLALFNTRTHFAASRCSVSSHCPNICRLGELKTKLLEYVSDFVCLHMDICYLRSIHPSIPFRGMIKPGSQLDKAMSLTCSNVAGQRGYECEKLAD